LDIYENSNSDSAIKYFKIYRAANERVFNTQAIQQTQLLTFEDELRQQKLADDKIKTEEQRQQNLQYALIALGIIIFIILFLLLSRSFITNTRLIEFFGVLALLIVFEFLNLLLHPFLERVTNHTPVVMLLALVCIAAILIPLHRRVEKWSTAKLVEKNKRIRLALAKKTIEKLENNKTN
jgi:amino acid permease